MTTNLGIKLSVISWIEVAACKIPTSRPDMRAAAAALMSGLLVGILQAATSIQEMTLSFIPKLVVMTLAIILFGEWQIAVLADYFETIFERVRTITL